MESLLAFMMGLADRQRGAAGFFLWPELPWNNRSLDKLVYGLVAAMSVLWLYGGNVWLILPLVTVGMFIGMSPGWGEPIGAALGGRPMDPANAESLWRGGPVWQRGILKRTTWAALVVRGLIWGVAAGLPIISIAPAAGAALIVSFTVAFPAAVALATITDRNWEMQEYYRGWIAGLMLIILAN